MNYRAAILLMVWTLALWTMATPTCAVIADEAAPSASPGKPNFIVIFIDDMGYGDIGPFGSKINQTPHLDRMAEEGMKLSSFYVAAPVCTPSRAALMTGCYPKRVGLARGSGHAVLFPGDYHGLDPDEITVAEILKDAGYATGCFGKWHLGDQPQFLPGNQGFDEYYGIPYSNDMWHGHPRHKDGTWDFSPLPIVHNGEAVGEVKGMDDQALLCKQFTDEAVKFIRQNKDRPFFVYLPHAFVHHPRAAREPFMEQAKNVTEAQIEEVDWSAGQILGALRELNLGEKTLVIFTSDNGSAGGCVNAPLRGGKGSAWEGGMREPTLAWWPGHVPAGSVCEEVATAMDVLPTFAALAGAQVPKDRIIDGKDISPLLLGKFGAKSPHEAFFYYCAERLEAVRSGPWKFFANGRLFNLDQDIGERNDVAQQNSDVVNRLRGYLDRARDDLGDGDRPGRNCRSVGVVQYPRTILPRPGLEGDAAFAPTLAKRKQ